MRTSAPYQTDIVKREREARHVPGFRAFCGAIGLVLIYAFTGLKIDRDDDPLR
jgi:hypothetical protein